MITKEEFYRHAEALLHFCEYPAIWKIMIAIEAWYLYNKGKSKTVSHLCHNGRT